jgi:serine/threonine-protein kinase CHEK2
VLYICLCGFPPFSDELYSPENPYTLAQQILQGRFDYPSPYWDSVGDPALDLIDKMLTVDPEKRYTVDECLQHPWTTGRELEPTQMSYDSTEGLTGAIAQLDFSKRKPIRERTLLSELNDVRVTRVVEPSTDSQGNNLPAIKVFEKNRNKKPYSPSQQQRNGGPVSPAQAGAEENGAPPAKEKKGKKGRNKKPAATKKMKEPSPGHNRAPEEFMALGGAGPDQPLFGYDGESRYVSPDTIREVKKRAKRK